MSDLHRAFAKAKLAALPAESPIIPGMDDEEDNEEDEETDTFKDLPRDSHDDDSSSASSASSTGTIRPSPTKHLFAKPKGSVMSRCAIVENMPLYESQCSPHSFRLVCGPCTLSTRSGLVTIVLTYHFLVLRLPTEQQNPSPGPTISLRSSTWMHRRLMRRLCIMHTLPHRRREVHSSLPITVLAPLASLLPSSPLG